MDKKDLVLLDVKNLKADAAIINNEFNRYWYTDFYSSAGFVIIHETKSILLIDNRYFEAAKKKVKNCEVRLFKNYNDLSDIFKELNIKTLVVEEEYTTLEVLNKLQELGCKTVGVLSRKWRIVKDNKALKALKKAAEIAAASIEWIRKQKIIGKTEKEVAKMIAIHMLELGATSNSFDLIVATGKNGAVPHHSPDDTILESGNLVTVDIGCMYDHYASDITRTFALGKKLKDKRLEVLYNTVLEANLKGISAAKANVTGEEVDKVCRDYIDAFPEYKGYFTHSTGHGVGLEVHELPYVSPRAKNVLEVHEVCTVEPGIYIPGVGGARVEDTLIIQKNKPVVITDLAKKNLYNE